MELKNVKLEYGNMPGMVEDEIRRQLEDLPLVVDGGCGNGSRISVDCDRNVVYLKPQEGCISYRGLNNVGSTQYRVDFTGIEVTAPNSWVSITPIVPGRGLREICLENKIVGWTLNPWVPDDSHCRPLQKPVNS
jgi:hypothetical protein